MTTSVAIQLLDDYQSIGFGLLVGIESFADDASHLISALAREVILLKHLTAQLVL